MNTLSPIKLSVVTVCWNDRDNVERTMHSLENQSQVGLWEHVLVDGASSDGTVGWYQSKNFSFPTRVFSAPDNGVFDAMNNALELVRGDYVVFMNAGDKYADDEAVARQISRLQDGPLWGYSRARVVDSSGRKIRPQVGQIPYSRMRHLLGRATICHQAVVMQVNFLRQFEGFDTGMGQVADYHLLIKAASVALPATWDTVDVDYLAGGISDSGVFKSLWGRHLARAEALSLRPSLRALDAFWTATQVVQIRLRKLLKPLVGSAYLKIRK